MKENEFFREHGWKEAMQVWQEAWTVRDCTSFRYKGFSLNLVEITRLLRSHSIVFEHGSLDRAKRYLESKYVAPELKDYLSKAITDVESCQ